MSKKRPARASTAPKSMKRDSGLPRARRSKTPPPGAVATEQLALTPTPPPADLTPTPIEASHDAPLPRPGLLTLRDGSPVALQAGGWREPDEAPARREEEPAKAQAVPVDGDEISVPAAVEDLDHQFFDSQPPPPSARARLSDTFADLDVPAPDPLLEHKLSRAVQQRRARLAKYVKAAVGVAAGVCFIAAAVHLGTRRTEAQAAPTVVIAPERAAAAAPPAPPPTEPATAAAATEPAVAAETAEPAAAEPESAGADTAPPADDTKADETATPSAGLDVELAKKEKRQSQQALERYDLKTAIEAGEQAVVHDPTDAEAWLILGAAYQTKGKMTDAKRCFKACIEQGKGPHRWECYQFPH